SGYSHSKGQSRRYTCTPRFHVLLPRFRVPKTAAAPRQRLASLPTAVRESTEYGSVIPTSIAIGSTTHVRQAGSAGFLESRTSVCSEIRDTCAPGAQPKGPASPAALL